MESAILLVIVFAAYKGFQQWLSFKERQARQDRALMRAKPTQPEWEIVDDPPRGAQVQFSPPESPPIPAAPVKTGMNKWLFIALCALYVCFPFDLVPDFIPVAGWGDDAVAIFLAIQKLMRG